MHDMVVHPGARPGQCDSVYRAFASADEGECSDTVWRQGELLSYEAGGADAVIRWVEDSLAVDTGWDLADGWWVRLAFLQVIEVTEDLGDKTWPRGSTRSRIRMPPGASPALVGYGAYPGEGLPSS